MAAVNFAGSVEKEQVTVAKAVSLAAVFAAMVVLVTEPLAMPGVTVAVAVAADALATLIMTHKRESSSTYMISPASFLITMLPR